MGTLFESVAAAMPKAEPKQPDVPLVGLEAVSSIEELGEKLEAVVQAKKYVTFGSLSKALGKETMRPSDIPVLLSAVSQVNPKYQALIVNSRGRHAEKVAEQHRTTLEELGYEQFPGVQARRKKATQPTETI
jgi:CTP synthase (UTP-ammonia lyase)